MSLSVRYEGSCLTLHTVHIVPRCRAPNPCLPQQDTIPYVLKKPQSCAPEDGQKFARNMMSLSWRSIKLLLLHLVGFYITLPKFNLFVRCKAFRTKV